MRFNKISLVVLAMGSSMLMAACGGGDSSPAAAAVASASVTTTISKDNPAAAAAVVSSVFDKSLAFASGVPAFGTTTATTLALTRSSNAAAPTFNLASAQGTASGAMTFGSCIFTITTSTYAAGSPLALGQIVTVNPCSIFLDTTGKPANGSATSVNVTMVLGTTTSAPVAVVASISATGVVTVNGTAVATATVSAATGASQ